MDIDADRRCDGPRSEAGHSTGALGGPTRSAYAAGSAGHGKKGGTAGSCGVGCGGVTAPPMCWGQ
jgi:hypothetical protein